MLINYLKLFFNFLFLHVASCSFQLMTRHIFHVKVEKRRKFSKHSFICKFYVKNKPKPLPYQTLGFIHMSFSYIFSFYLNRAPNKCVWIEKTAAAERLRWNLWHEKPLFEAKNEMKTMAARNSILNIPLAMSK